MYLYVHTELVLAVDCDAVGGTSESVHVATDMHHDLYRELLRIQTNLPIHGNKNKSRSGVGRFYGQQCDFSASCHFPFGR